MRVYFTCPAFISIMVQLIQLLQVVLLKDGGPLYHLSSVPWSTLSPVVRSTLPTRKPGKEQISS